MPGKAATAAFCVSSRVISLEENRACLGAVVLLVARCPRQARPTRCPVPPSGVPYAPTCAINKLVTACWHGKIPRESGPACGVVERLSA
jgi:hypothetical protein